MVLPLQKLCLATLRDSLNDQPNPYLHQIPPPNRRQNLRQDLLDLVLAFGVISQESAYTSLTSPEFLAGLSKLNTHRGITSDAEYLDRVADKFSHVQGNGKTIGEGIAELKLNLYTWRVHTMAEDGRVAMNLDSAVRVISQCPNLKILHLSIVKDQVGWKRWEHKNLADLPLVFDKSSSDGGILNQVLALAPCLGVLENVEELSLSGDREPYYQAPCLTRKRPIVTFRRLSSLYLDTVSVDPKAWKEFLMTIQNSLVELEVHGVDADELLPGENMEWILPFRLPNLRSFTMERCSGGYTYRMIKNLMECPNLEKVMMGLSANVESYDAMRLLSQMKVSLELELLIHLNEDRDHHFKWVDMFKEKIKKVVFEIRQWNTHQSTALEHLVATCPDLVEISFHISPHVHHAEEEHEVVYNRLTAAINSDLAPFLRDQAFVSKLRRLEFYGQIDGAVLDTFFENASSLEWLKMIECPQISDSHLQLWALKGGKPECLVLLRCENITDDGLVPILINSGQRMTKFWSNSDLGRITMATWRTLVDHCPSFSKENMPTELENLLDPKCPNIS